MAVAKRMSRSSWPCEPAPVRRSQTRKGPSRN